MRIKLITAPTIEPVTISQAKNQIGINEDEYEHDLKLDRYIASARQWAENYLAKSLIQRTYDLWLDKFPSDYYSDYIELPRPPLQSISSFTYTDCDGDDTELTEDTHFTVDADTDNYGRIILAYGYTWPTATLNPDNPIKIRFVAGYDDDGSSPPDYRANIPEAIIQAILLYIENLFFKLNNEEQIKSLLIPYKAWKL